MNILQKVTFEILSRKVGQIIYTKPDRTKTKSVDLVIYNEVEYFHIVNFIAKLR